jgi:NNP family nitrate/nitrite transporter-like MFS transporter
LFTSLVFVLGSGMGIGKAAVYKLIPEHFPRDVGAVGGMVGMLGALGGFALPPTWAYLNDWSQVPQSMFAVLTLLTASSAVWFLVSERQSVKVVAEVPALEMAR